MEAEGKIEAVAAFAPAMTAKPQERAFWIALACAAVVHAVLIAGFVQSPPRQLGEKNGRSDGVSVEMVDAADLGSKNTFAEDGALPGSPAPAPAAQSAPPSPKDAEPPLKEEVKPAQEDAKPAKQEPKPAQEDTQPAKPEVKPAEEAKPAEKAAKEEAKAAKQEALPPPNDAKTPELVSADEAARQGKTAKEQKKAAPDTLAWPIETQGLDSTFPQADKPSEADAPPSKKTAKPQQAPKASPRLQLSLPDTAIAPGVPSAAFSRPAGITRSGENDEFGRGVIRALRKTMPSLGAIRGRVTVRFLLSADGNLVEVSLVRSSGDPMLDQYVMFAVKQSSFPFPPRNAPLVDRTFLVTYVYETRPG